MATCNNFSIDKDSLLQDDSIQILKGKRSRFKINIYEKKEGKIVVPTTIDVTNISVDIFSEDSVVTPIIQDTPTKEDILNASAQKTGVTLYYMIDTSLAQFETEKKYAIVFNYDLPNGERDCQIIYFSVIPFGFVDFSGC